MDSIIRGANLYVENTNQALRAETLQLPDLERDMDTLSIAGGFFALDLPGQIKGLTFEVELNGSHDDLRSLFGREPGDWSKFVYYENLLNVFPTGENAGPKLKGRTTIMKGLLNKVTQPQIKNVKAGGTTKYTFGSIILYHDLLNGKTIHKIDVPRNVLIINGVNYTAEHNRLLRI